MKIKLIVLTLLLVFIISACECPEEILKEECIFQEGNIIVAGCRSQGYIQNIGDETVRIKAVWQYTGEKTSWIEDFEPMKKKEMYMHGHQRAFYIMSLDGVELDFIKSGYENENYQR